MIHLREHETILREARRHWLVIASEGAILFLGALAPAFALLGFLSAERILQVHLEIPLSAILFFYAAWLLFLWIVFFVFWTNYYLDVLIITDQRLIDVEQISLFARESVSVPYENIEDVKVEVFGLIPSLFKFGNLHVQTAGETKEVLIKHLSRPHEAERLIAERLHALRARAAIST